ncbi:MAG TPA: WXG100 family type VII secretion target [Glycomyces sp.]|nr:WXG100 family type VII secretion target [Glycomyces sp.]
MPTYEQALAADPAAFVDYASEMREAGADLTEHQNEYNTEVGDINSGWRDQANTAFNEDVARVNVHVGEVVLHTGEAAEVLDEGGARMAAVVERLQGLDAAYRGGGFTVAPEPRVELGAVHWAAIVAAGAMGPMLHALFQARADEGTMQLQLGLAELNMTDAVTGAALTSAADLLQPLEEKSDEEPKDPPTIEVRERPEGEDEPGGKKRPSGEDGGSGEDGDEKKRGSDEDDKKRGSDDDERDEKPEPPVEPQPPQQPREDERPEDRSPSDVEPPLNPVPDAQPPDSSRPVLPDLGTNPAELSTPDTGDYESSWDPSELTGEDLTAGGLASGGGLGGGGGLGTGGLGPGELPAGGGPSGAVGVPSAGGASPAATGSGARPGPGGMMGAPGARGGAAPDNEVERESFLREDPEEDVWGIGDAESDPYADPQERQGATDPFPPPADEPFRLGLPGFDLPGTDRP